MIDIDVLTLIPQRPPFVAIDKLLSCNELKTETSFKIFENFILTEDGKMSEAGIIENFAQTGAARLGYLNLNGPVKIGMIGSVDNLQIWQLPEVNSNIFTTITVLGDFMGFLIVEAESKCDEQPVASCKMKIFLTDIRIS